jgi:RimJ/RimL family protein N-acetyltransferase
MPGLILETARLSLREMTLDDLDFMSALLGDAEVMRYYPRSLSRDEAREWIERQLGRYADFGHGHWLAELRDTGEPVGQVGLVAQEIEGQIEREIGYMFHHRFWRQGFATEGALGIRRHAFEERGFDHVISLVRPENVPSQGVARKLGMHIDRDVEWRGYRHHVFLIRRDEIA